MKIVVAPDKFKGCLSAAQVAHHIAAGISAALPSAQIIQCPMADGGEGTVDTILRARGGCLINRRVTGPLPEMKVDASFALLGDGTTAVIEISAASGLALLKPEDQNPLNTTTFGTGELIVAAIREGAKKIILGLGGSATIDGGIGCIQACGYTVLLKDGQPTAMTEPLCGRDVADVLMIKHGRGEVTAGIEIIAATDVTNPLLGATGAAQIFGRQKGATAEIIAQLEMALSLLSERTGTVAEARQSGAGAAGGLGYGVISFMNGKLANGFELVAGQIDFAHLLENVALCITGEGRLDSQSSGGKTVVGIARMCRTAGVPCVAIAGGIDLKIGELQAEGLTAHFSICDKPMSMEQAFENTAELLTQSAYQCIKLWSSNRN